MDSFRLESEEQVSKFRRNRAYDLEKKLFEIFLDAWVRIIYVIYSVIGSIIEIITTYICRKKINAISEFQKAYKLLPIYDYSSLA